jgi:hypothetical protein
LNQHFDKTKKSLKKSSSIWRLPGPPRQDQGLLSFFGITAPEALRFVYACHALATIVAFQTRPAPPLVNRRFGVPIAQAGWNGFASFSPTSRWTAVETFEESASGARSSHSSFGGRLSSLLRRNLKNARRLLVLAGLQQPVSRFRRHHVCAYPSTESELVISSSNSSALASMLIPARS